MEYDKKNYHHGDLKNALIEAGIRIVNQQGEAALSLRKVAALCCVSAAAPYAHFKSKEELVVGMQEYVTEKFTLYLHHSVKKTGTAREKLLSLGRAYVRFF